MISTYHLTSEDCQSLDVDNSSDLKRKQKPKNKQSKCRGFSYYARENNEEKSLLRI